MVPKDPRATTGLRYLYSNGVEVIHGPGARGIRFVGTDGEVNVDRGFLMSKPAEIIKVPIGAKDVHLNRSPGHQRDWLNCVRNRRSPICDVEIGARSVTVCHLVNLSYYHHQSFKWDPAKFKFAGGTGDKKWLDREYRSPWRLA